ncbi:DUF1054 family protein [Staphylococcus aureus]
MKQKIKQHVQKFLKENLKLFNNYLMIIVFASDHMKPDKPFIKDLTDDDLKEAIQRAINVKKGEFFIARAITPQDKRLKSDKAFIAFLEETFDQFLPFYSA